MVKLRSIKKILKYVIICLVIIIGYLIFLNYPASSEPKNLPRLADTSNIKRNLEAIIHTNMPRNFLHVEVLDTVAAYLKNEFLQCSERVVVQGFVARNKTYKNIIVSFGPADGERIIVGAHYDVCGEQDGADDDASGVAGILELARLLKNTILKYRVDLVAYSLEEPPFFRTRQMGSYVHAKSLFDAHVPVKGMVSLEMIGYFSNEENSQDYPLGMMKWFYGSKGNYITIVQKPMQGDFSKQFKQLAFENNSILTKSFRAPFFLGGLDLSDHRNYWKFGYSALMVTNTAFYRNNNYHKRGDILSNLNIPNIGLVVDGVFRVLKEMK